MATTFDMFGTLVETPSMDDTATAIACELERRGVQVPDDWETVFHQRYIEAPEGAEVPLHAHVARALATQGIKTPDNAARKAVVAAFDVRLEPRPGARQAVLRAAEAGPVGVLSNCAVPGLVRRALVDAGLRWMPDTERCPVFDTIVTSVGCGWRKPHPKAFETVAAQLETELDNILHIGDNPDTDGGIERLGGQFIDVTDRSLEEITFD